MILIFQRTYQYAMGGLTVVTFNPGDRWDVDPAGPDKDAVTAVLERGDAIESKPDSEAIENTIEQFVMPTPATVAPEPVRRGRNRK